MPFPNVKKSVSDVNESHQTISFFVFGARSHPMMILDRMAYFDALKMDSLK